MLLGLGSVAHFGVENTLDKIVFLKKVKGQMCAVRPIGADDIQLDSDCPTGRLSNITYYIILASGKCDWR